MVRPSGVKLGYSSQPALKVMRRVPLTVTSDGSTLGAASTSGSGGGGGGWRPKSA